MPPRRTATGSSQRAPARLNNVPHRSSDPRATPATAPPVYSHWRRRWQRLAPVARSHDGQPQVSPREWRLSRLVVAAALVWLLYWACAGLLGPLLAGHYAASASVGIIADNMLHWHIAGPVWRYTAAAPHPSDYYCHHPWGIFWTQAGFSALLGRHDYVLRLPPIVASAGTVVLLYRLGTSVWRPAAGAMAAAAFVCLPITLSFAHFNALEVPVMFWSTLGMLGYWRYLRTGQNKYLWLSVCGWSLALNSDWPAFMLLATLLAFEWFRARLPNNSFHPLRRAWIRRWWLWLASILLLVGIGYLALFQHYGQLNALIYSYHLRAGHTPLSWWQTLLGRRYWLALMFTPLALLLAAISACWCLFEWLLLRRWTATLPLAVGIMASAQYLLFPQGADVHIFWPHYFALFFALGCGALTNAALGCLAPPTRAVAGSPTTSSTIPLTRAGALILALAGAVWLVVARDAAEVADYARASGGRFNEHGLYIHSDGDKTAVLKHLATQLPHDGRVALHQSMRGTWAQVWALGGRVVRPHAAQPKPGDAIMVADSRFVSDRVQRNWLSRYRITAVGPYWWFRPSAPAAGAHPANGLAAQHIDEKERSWWGRYWWGAHQPAYSFRQAPFLTWALRSHFGLPAAVPSAAPAGPEPWRIAHNIALQQGDVASATAWREKLLKHMRGPRVTFEDGTRLLASRFEPGSRPRLWLLFEAAAPLPPRRRPALRSRVLEGPRWSTTMADPTVREVGPPLALKASRWRRGWLYSYTVDIDRRPGREVFELYFRDGDGPRPQRASMRTRAGEDAVRVLTLGE